MLGSTIWPVRRTENDLGAVLAPVTPIRPDDPFPRIVPVLLRQDRRTPRDPLDGESAWRFELGRRIGKVQVRVLRGGPGEVGSVAEVGRVRPRVCLGGR